MTIQQAQQEVDQWIKTTGVRYFSELTNMAILTEEVGELARIMARKYGDQSFKETEKEASLSDEMADVLWVLICLANQTGVDLAKALQKNIEKKTLRDAQTRDSPCEQNGPPKRGPIMKLVVREPLPARPKKKRGQRRGATQPQDRQPQGAQRQEQDDPGFSYGCPRSQSQ